MSTKISLPEDEKNESKYQCKVCSKKYNLRCSLWRHNQKCKKVDEVDDLVVVLESMIKKIHQQSNNNNITNVLEIIMHQRHCSKDRTHKLPWDHCFTCDKYFSTQSNMNRHLQSNSHLSRSSYEDEVDKECKHQCKVCYKKYNLQSSLWRHNQKCKKVDDVVLLKNKISKLENLLLKIQNSNLQITDHFD